MSFHVCWTMCWYFILWSKDSLPSSICMSNTISIYNMSHEIYTRYYFPFLVIGRFKGLIYWYQSEANVLSHTPRKIDGFLEMKYFFFNFALDLTLIPHMPEVVNVHSARFCWILVHTNDVWKNSNLVETWCRVRLCAANHGKNGR